MTLLRKGKGGVVISVAWQRDRIWNQVEEGHLGVPVKEDCINWREDLANGWVPAQCKQRELSSRHTFIPQYM